MRDEGKPELTLLRLTGRYVESDITEHMGQGILLQFRLMWILMTCMQNIVFRLFQAPALMSPYNDKTASKLLKNARKISFHGGKEYFPSTDRRTPVSEKPFSKSLDTRIKSCLLRRQWLLHSTTTVIAKPCVYLSVVLHLFEKSSFHPLASIGVQESWSSDISGWLLL